MKQAGILIVSMQDIEKAKQQASKSKDHTQIREEENNYANSENASK